MDTTRLQQIQSENASKELADKRHQDLLAGSVQVSNTVIDSTVAILKYLEGATSRVQVVNQLEKIGTPDAFKVVQAVNQLHTTLKTHKNTDLTEVTKVMKDVLDQIKLVPKDHPDIKEPKVIDYSKQLKALDTTVKAIETAIKKQKLIAEAPIVNVDKPDLEPLRAAINSVVSAVNNIDMPKPESPYTKKGKSVKVELDDGAVPTSQTNILITEKFDEYKLIYGDEFSDESTNPSQIKYFLNKKKVATLTLSYDDRGRLTGAKKS